MKSPKQSNMPNLQVKQQAKPQKSKPTIRFIAELPQPKANKKDGKKDSGVPAATAVTILTLPKSASAKFPSKGKTTIEGIVNSFPIQTASIEPNGKGGHTLKFNKPLPQPVVADAFNTNTLTVEITRVGEETDTRVPPELTKSFVTSPKAKKLWDEITPIARRDWIFWIISGKQEETRMKRSKTACSKLSSGMRRVCCFGGISWLIKTAESKSKRS